MSVEHIAAPLAVQDVDPRSLHESPRNPRTIDPARFEQLKRSLEADPEMLRARPVIALPSGQVVAGNMRHRAVLELGWPTVPTVYADLDDRRASEWMLRDNNEFGGWEDNSLSDLLAELQAGATDLSLLGFEAGELERLLAQADGRVVDPESALGEWQGMPEFEHENQMAYRTINVHFADEGSVRDFARLMGQALTDRTKFLWHPEQKPQVLGHYDSAES